jgi:uncharacterized protein (TIGR02246 family)
VKRFIALPMLLLLLLALQGLAQAPAKEDPAHDELRGLLKQVLKAYNSQDIDQLVSHFTDDAVVTWQNSKVTKTPKGIKEYFEEMSKGPNARVTKATVDPEVEELTHLYGNTGIAFGKSKDYFLLNDGLEFTQNSRWTAAVVKKDGQWKVAALHICVNMFDNPVLELAVKRTGMYAGGLGLVLGLLVGVVGVGLLRRSRKAPAGA